MVISLVDSSLLGSQVCKVKFAYILIIHANFAFDKNLSKAKLKIFLLSVPDLIQPTNFGISV